MRKKIVYLREVAEAANVIQEGKPLYKRLRGGWHSYFGNDYPIVLELGCGRGDYTIALAERYPDKNFIGVDIKGPRLWFGSRRALEGGLKNVVFLRTNIAFISDFFAEGEVSELYVTFPDPEPKPKRAKHRLMHPRFLRQYELILTAGGLLHLKTDYYDFF